MPLAQNPAVFIHAVSGHIHHASVNRDDRVRLDYHAIKFQFHPALAHKVAGIFVVLEAPLEITVIRQHRSPVLLNRAHLAEHRVAGRGSF